MVDLRGVGTASMVTSALANGIPWLRERRRDAARRRAVIEKAEAALGRLVHDRLHHSIGCDEACAHEIGDPHIALQPAQVPVQTVEILLRASEVSSVCGPGSLSG